MREKKYPVVVVVGDWSDDGHGKADYFVLLSSLSQEEVAAAYERGSKKVGFDLCNDVAESYDDRSIEVSKIKSLLSLGFIVEEDDFDWPGMYSEPEVSFEEALENLDSLQIEGSDVFARIYFFIVKLGNPFFEYSFMDDRLCIGGYGLYE